MRTFFIFSFCFLISILGFIFPTYSGEWRDTFDGEKLEGWTLISKGEAKNWESSWELKDGELNVTLNLPDFFPMVADFLQWTARPINTDSLTVIVDDMNGWLCIFLGKRMLEPNFASGYRFGIASVWQIQFDRKGNFIEGRMRASYWPRPQFKVIFQAGRFRVFSLDVLLTDFEDKELQRVDVVGLLISAGGGDKRSHGSIDTFSISGSGIPDHNRDVQSERKLTTTWGKLKVF